MKYNTDLKTITKEGNKLLVNGKVITSMSVISESSDAVIARLAYLVNREEAMVGTYIRVVLGKEEMDTLEAVTYLLESMSYEQLLELTCIERINYEGR